MECIFALRSQSEDVDGKTSETFREAQRICIARLAHPWAKQAGRAHDASELVEKAIEAQPSDRVQDGALTHEGHTRNRIERRPRSIRSTRRPGAFVLAACGSAAERHWLAFFPWLDRAD